MLLVSLVFGYAQWRRQWLIAEVKSLNAMGGRMMVGEGVSVENMATLPSFMIRDGFWPSVRAAGDFVVHDALFSQSFASGRVPICFAEMRDGTYRLGGDDNAYGVEELRAQLSDIEARLRLVGLDDVEFWEYREFPNYVGRTVTKDVNSIGD